MNPRDSFSSIDDICEQLRHCRYITDQSLATVLYLSYHLHKPIFLEAIMSSQGNAPVLLIDELDRGEIDVLEAQMARLKRKSYKIIWLNPLMGSADYQPNCQGMRTALPYVDSFLPMDTPRDLAILVRMLGKMMA